MYKRESVKPLCQGILDKQRKPPIQYELSLTYTCVGKAKLHMCR